MYTQHVSSSHMLNALEVASPTYTKLVFRS